MLRAFRLFVPWPLWVLWGVDLITAVAAIVAGLMMSYAELASIISRAGPYPGQVVLFALSVSLYLFIFGGYSKRAVASFKLAISCIAIAHFAVFCTLVTFFYFFPAYRIWLSALLPALAISFVSISIVHRAFDLLVAHRFLRRRIFVLGQGQSADRLEALVRADAFPMIEMIGSYRVPPANGATSAQSDRTIAEIDKALTSSVDEIVLAFDDRRNHMPVDSLLKVRMRGVDVSYVTTFLERQQGRVEIDAQPSWMIFSSGFTAGQRFERVLKRVFDVLGSLTILVLTFPLIALSALAVVLQDFSSPFYRQERVGLNGKRFSLYKLRTMCTDAEGDGLARWAARDDSRVTAIGKFLRRTRIDELPQLLNVIQGRMSLIGPRPERPEIVEELKGQIPYFDYRHVVKPGISGWAQLNYPYGATIEDSKEKLAYDLFYIKNYSWMLDLVILLQTLRVVIWPHAQAEDLAVEDLGEKFGRSAK